MFIADAHLDLAYNALRRRNPMHAGPEQPPAGQYAAAVSLPELRRGGVGLIGATIFCQPWKEGSAGGYRSAEESREMARAQLRWYRDQFAAGKMHLVRNRAELPAAGVADGQWEGHSPGAILLMEGAEPIQSVEDVSVWWEAGVRVVGLAWSRTRYAGGTDQPGPLTAEGIALVRALDELGAIHDASHLAEEAFWQLLEISSGPVMASHSNCRGIVPGERQLSDDMIRAIAGRGGMIGINLYDRFLVPASELGQRACRLADVVRQVRYICDLTGSVSCVGLGTDMDGGFGPEHLPAEIRSCSDLPRLAGALAGAGFSAQEVMDIMGGNWLRYFKHYLPG